MKNMKKTLLLGSAVFAVASLLALGVKSVSASGTLPSGTIAAGVKPRVNNAASAGNPLSKEAKASKVFGADGTATLVTDEKGNAPTTGSLAALDIGGTTPGAVPQCYLMAFDSSVASDTTEAGSVSAMLVPPFSATSSGVPELQLAYPAQFHKGLVVLVGGAGKASCRASVRWLRNGGDN